MAMEKHLFNLKFAAKQLERDSKKCDKEEKAEKNKLKKAIEKGNMEVARIHAENGKKGLNKTSIHIIVIYKKNDPIFCFLSSFFVIGFSRAVLQPLEVCVLGLF